MTAKARTAVTPADVAPATSVGAMLRRWRAQRRMSQLDLALSAEVSSRHLSFVESGRAAASRELLGRLAQELNLPLRARNQLLLAGGYAPQFPDPPLDAPELAAARAAVEAVLEAHAPFPALAVDRRWTLLRANAGLARLLQGVGPELLAEPVNVLRLALHPLGLAPEIENLAEWRHHLLERLRRQAEDAGDPELATLHDELSGYPAPAGKRREAFAGQSAIAVPLVLRASELRPRLALLSMTMVFGTATSVTLSELALECFYPADELTRNYLLGR